MVNLISKDANLVFYLSAYKLNHFPSGDYDAIIIVSCQFNVIDDVIRKVQRHDDLKHAHAVRYAFFHSVIDVSSRTRRLRSWIKQNKDQS